MYAKVCIPNLHMYICMCTWKAIKKAVIAHNQSSESRTPTTYIQVDVDAFTKKKKRIQVTFMFDDKNIC